MRYRYHYRFSIVWKISECPVSVRVKKLPLQAVSVRRGKEMERRKEWSIWVLPVQPDVFPVDIASLGWKKFIQMKSSHATDDNVDDPRGMDSDSDARSKG